jgi:hypothetical protein
MRKFLIAIIAVALMGLGITSAYADGDGSCAVSGSTVTFHVNEDPAEGGVSYISIKSLVQLDTASTGPEHTRARLFYADGDEALNNPVYAYSSPVDGDGYWNYRIDAYFYYPYPVLYIDHVHMNIEKYNSTSRCYDDVYI